MSISSEQSSRQQYLQQKELQRQKAKEEAMQQAEDAGEQYKPPKEKPNFREILGNGGQSIEKEQKRLSELYSRMYQIYKNRPDLLKNTSGLYRTIGYDSMSNQEKKIVDYFLGGKQPYKITDDSLNI